MADALFLKPFAGAPEEKWPKNTEPRRAKIWMAENNYGVDIRIEGYGCYGDDEAGLIHIEPDYVTNKLRMLYWPDINYEGPVDVDLSEAALENREWEDE